MSEIIVALITGALSLLGVVITNKKSNDRIQIELTTSQSVMEYKIEELTREVRKHNNFAEKIPVIEEKIKVVNKRIDEIKRDA